MIQPQKLALSTESKSGLHFDLGVIEDEEYILENYNCSYGLQNRYLVVFWAVDTKWSQF